MSDTTDAAGIPKPVTFKGVTYKVPPKLNFYQLAQIEDNFGSLDAIDLSSLKKQMDCAAVALSMKPTDLGNLISADITTITGDEVKSGAEFLREVLMACGMLTAVKPDPEPDTAAKNDEAAPPESREPSSEPDTLESA